MMEFAKDLASNIGCALADFAKAVGNNSVDAAKFVGSNAPDAARFVGRNTADGAMFVGRNTADAAKFLGSGAADIAKRVGPKRALIGLAVLGGAIAGGVYLSRYLRARAAAAADETDGIKNKRVKKAASRAEHAAQGLSH